MILAKQIELHSRERGARLVEACALVENFFEESKAKVGH